jgi:hypothetical protein
MLRVLLLAFFFCAPQFSPAEVQVEVEKATANSGFTFETLPSPAVDDFGSKVNWRLVGGVSDPNGAPLAALHDGNVPTSDDEPLANFFFQAGTQGGKILADLGETHPIERISSYSWHRDVRGPQVFSVYGTSQEASGNQIKGWKKIADVDTRPEGDTDPGGRYGVSLTDPEGRIGSFRYLLFDIKPTGLDDRFGLTFFSEIDIVSESNGQLEFVKEGKPLKLVTFRSEDDKYQFQIDATAAPDLLKWSESELAPVIEEWYPKLVEMLPDEGYTAPTKVSFRFRNDMHPGIPGSATLFRINLNAPWFRKELLREAKGCVVHEMVHIVQGYRRTKETNPNAVKTPSWVVEGLADYIRWFLYEPETGGALLSPDRLKQARHDASYRTTANFIDWVARTQDDEILQKMNSAARRGEYSDGLWEEFTGKPVETLADEWRSQE